MITFFLCTLALNTFSITSSTALPIANSIQTSPVVDVLSEVTPSNVRTAAHAFQDGTITHFPNYAVVLLALFTIVCGASCALMLALCCSKTLQKRPYLAAKPVSEASAGARGGARAQNQKPAPRAEEKAHGIARSASAPQLPNNDGDHTPKPGSTAHIAEKVDINVTLSADDARDSEPDSGPPEEREATDDPYLVTSEHPTLASTSPEPLDKLVSASTMALDQLRTIISLHEVAERSRDDTPSESPIDLQLHAVAPSLQPIEDGVDDSVDDASIHTHSRNLHNSPCSTTLVPLVNALFPSAGEPSAASSPEISSECDITPGLAFPRYVPGIQLETIHEENESFSPCKSTFTRYSSIIPGSSVKTFLESSRDLDIHNHSNGILTTNTSHNILDAPFSNNVSLSDRIPNTWEELGINSQNLSHPRVLPSWQSASSSSTPVSALVVPALRQGYREEENQPVTWLSPVIEKWAVDDDSDEPLGGRDAVVPQDEDDNSDALQAADALAIVMDSLAAMGMDPTTMDLMAEDVASFTSSRDLYSPPPSSAYLDESHKSFPSTGENIDANEVEKAVEFGYMSGSSVSEGVQDTVHYRANVLSSTDGSESKGTFHSANFGVTSDETHLPEPSNSQREAEPPEQRQEVLGKRPRSSAYASQNISSPNNPVNRTPRNTRQDPRAYPSPSSLAGLSPAEASKRLSTHSASSGSLTPPRERPSYSTSPPVSPLQIRKIKGRPLSPTLGRTPSTVTDSPRNDSESRSQSPLFHKRVSMSTSPSAPRTLVYPRPPVNAAQSSSPRKGMRASSSSPVSLSRRPKQAENFLATLQEKSQSMDV